MSESFPITTSSRLLEAIVDAAAKVVGARSASLLLIDRGAQDLVFAVALGPAADRVRGRRLPSGRGIAGLVAHSGEPISVADVEADPRHAAEIARDAGYHPRTLLCVPLLADDEVIGVLELLDRHDSAPFDLRDMQVAIQFAQVAVSAIEQGAVSVTDASPDELYALASRVAAYGARESAACKAILQAFLSALELDRS